MKLFAYFVLPLLLAACGDNPSPAIVSTSCSIDVPPANTVLPAARRFNLAGWAYDAKSGAVSEEYQIHFVSTDRKLSKVISVKPNVKRTDVAQAFNDKVAESSGFNLEVPANTLAPGKYEIVISQNLKNGIFSCGNKFFYEVK